VKAHSQKLVETILRPGQMVGGQYRVDHLVGQGGMAAVWAGVNEHTGKRVALKVILLSLSTTRDAQNLFHREALAASRVNHPNVVSVFDIIEHEGMTCIVMEMLDGESLGSYIARKGFLSVNEAATLLLPAMRGVAAANAQGVIHRDLKPQNIFICIEPDGRIVTTKVLDFGISVMMERVVDPLAGPIVALAVGTPAYMSPEHILGAAHIDGRADVYGFGVLLYEVLTGRMPFPGEPGPALFDSILNQPPLAVALLRPDLSPGLVRIIETAMAKQPDQRFSDLTSMVRAFEDELAPATPAPRLLTPFAGVPSIALRDPASGPHPNASKEHAPRTNGASNDGAEASVRPTPTGRENVLVDGRLSFPKPRLPGHRARPARRSWGGLVAAVVAVVLGFFAVSTVMRGATKVLTGAPAPATHATQSTSKLVAQPDLAAVVVSNATVAPVAVPAALADSPSPPAASALATREQSTLESHPLPVTPSPSRVTVRETPRSSSARRQALRGDSARNEPARAPSSASKAGAPAKSAALRAGRLSEADF
jgi:eukaryotic-like serine/threonine-protein kinase